MPSQSTTPRLDFSQVPDVVLYDLCALACGKAKGGKNQKSKLKSAGASGAKKERNE